LAIGVTMSEMIDRLIENANNYKDRILQLQEQVVELKERVEWYERILKRHNINIVTGEKYHENNG